MHRLYSGDGSCIESERSVNGFLPDETGLKQIKEFFDISVYLFFNLKCVCIERKHIPLRKKIHTDMKYQLQLEVEVADNKIAFTEEFFKSISFVRKVTAITPGTETSADAAPVKTKLSDKYRGVLSKEQGQSLTAHIREMRNETKKRSARLKATTPRAGCMKGTFTWMSNDFNAPVDDFNGYQ
jgi:hypothetical protein